MKKILFVIGNLNIGGPQKSLLALLDKLDYSVFSADVLSLSPGGNLKGYFNKNVRFIEGNELLYAMMLPVDHTVKSLWILLKHGRISAFFDAVKSILKFLLKKGTIMNQERQAFWKKHHGIVPRIEGEYDAVFGILGLSTYVAVDLVSAKKTVHWIRSDVRILRLNTEIEAEYFQKVDAFLSVSKECAEIFKEIYPFSAGRIQTFYNYIPVGFYSGMHSDTRLMDEYTGKKLITISRLMPMKGIEWAIDVCEELVKRKKEFRWFILGDGKMRAEYEETVRQKHLEEYVCFLGFQYNTLEFLKRADIFVHLSESEGKSNAVDEAVFARKPIVITEYPTVHEQIRDGSNGLICPFDISVIADKICLLLEDPEACERLSQNCAAESGDERDANGFLLNLMER